MNGLVGGTTQEAGGGEMATQPLNQAALDVAVALVRQWTCYSVLPSLFIHERALGSCKIWLTLPTMPCLNRVVLDRCDR